MNTISSRARANGTLSARPAALAARARTMARIPLGAAHIPPRRRGGSPAARGVCLALLLGLAVGALLAIAKTLRGGGGDAHAASMVAYEYAREAAVAAEAAVASIEALAGGASRCPGVTH